MSKAPSLSYLEEEVMKATRLLYPRARAFWMPKGGILECFHKVLAKSQAQAFRDTLLIIDSAIADNDNFTADDATDWERRLGIASGGSAVPLADRMLAINRKINHPGLLKPRQSRSYIENQLQAAGFNVFVYENMFPDGSGGYTTKTPEEIIGPVTGSAYHATEVEHADDLEHGAMFDNKIVNYINEVKDQNFDVGANYRCTFFIAGATIDTFASVPLARKNEFRQLILQLKPTPMVGFLFVNYV